LIDLIIPETQNTKFALREMSISLLIAPKLSPAIVLPPIDLNDQSTFANKRNRERSRRAVPACGSEIHVIAKNEGEPKVSPLAASSTYEAIERVDSPSTPPGWPSASHPPLPGEG
jgi:hypothetical protein